MFEFIGNMKDDVFTSAVPKLREMKPEKLTDSTYRIGSITMNLQTKHFAILIISNAFFLEISGEFQKTNGRWHAIKTGERIT